MQVEGAFVKWYGPFPLDINVLSQDGVPTDRGGVYLLIGWETGSRFSSFRLFRGPPKVLYAGQTQDDFLNRFAKHANYRNGSGAKIHQINSRRGLLDGVFIGRFQDPTLLTVSTLSGSPVLDVVESLFIWLFDPWLNDPKAPVPVVPPREGFTLVSKFNQDTWGDHKTIVTDEAYWPTWRASPIPDVLDFRPRDEGAGVAQLEWLGWHTNYRRRRWVKQKGGGAKPLRNRPKEWEASK